MIRLPLRWPLVAGAAAAGLAACAAYAAYIQTPRVSVQQHEAIPVKARPAVEFPKADHAGTPQAPAPRARYADAIREDMFSGPEPREPLPVHPLTPSPPQIQLPTVPTQPDPTADAVYAGCMTMNGHTIALIESRSSHEGIYVGEGDSWQSLPVVAVSPGAVTFAVNGVERALPISDTINVVQLSASAPGTLTGTVDPAQLDKKARKAAARAEKKQRAARKKAEKQRKKREKKAQQAIEEELAG